MSCPSATAVVWTSAWLHGAAAADDVLDALGSWAESHEVVAYDAATEELLDLPEVGSPALLLAAARKLGVTGGELVLPVAGDLRGLRNHAPFAAAALHAGEAAVLRTGEDESGVGAGIGDIGLVPERRRAADGLIRWTAFHLPYAGPAEHVPLGEAEHELSGAMRAAATALVELDVARHRPGVRDEIAALVNDQPRSPWPPGMPGRALRVLQRANEVAAILTVATTDAPGAAVSASAMRRRTDALRPLDHAVRAARIAAVNEAVRVLGDHAGKH